MNYMLKSRKEGEEITLTSYENGELQLRGGDEVEEHKNRIGDILGVE